MMKLTTVVLGAFLGGVAGKYAASTAPALAPLSALCPVQKRVSTMPRSLPRCIDLSPATLDPCLSARCCDGKL